MTAGRSGPRAPRRPTGPSRRAGAAAFGRRGWWARRCCGRWRARRGSRATAARDGAASSGATISHGAAPGASARASVRVRHGLRRRASSARSAAGTTSSRGAARRRRARARAGDRLGGDRLGCSAPAIPALRATRAPRDGRDGLGLGLDGRDRLGLSRDRARAPRTTGSGSTATAGSGSARRARVRRGDRLGLAHDHALDDHGLVGLVVVMPGGERGGREGGGTDRVVVLRLVGGRDGLVDGDRLVQRRRRGQEVTFVRRDDGGLVGDRDVRGLDRQARRLPARRRPRLGASATTSTGACQRPGSTGAAPLERSRPLRRPASAATGASGSVTAAIAATAATSATA